MRSLIMSVFCLFIFNYSFSQLLVTNINDTTRIYEDTAGKIAIPIADTYPLTVTFMGGFYHTHIQLSYNGAKVFYRKMTTMNRSGTHQFLYTSPKLILPVNQIKKNALNLRLEGTVINVPIMYGYAFLYISTSGDIINGKNRITYNFEFTNQEIRDL